MKNYLYPIYKSKFAPWIKWWILKGNKVMPKHLSEWINSAEAITLTGVYKGSPLLNLNLNGNTSQEGTPTPEAPVPVNVVKEDNYININGESYRVDLGGKNLLNIGNPYTYEQNGITATFEDTYVEITGKATTSSSFLTGFKDCNYGVGDVTFSIQNTLPKQITLRFYDSNNSPVRSLNIPSDSKSVTATLDGTEKKFRILLSTTVDSTYNLENYIMLEKRKYTNFIQSICCKSNRTMQNR